jgi:hypothetical protein
MGVVVEELSVGQRIPAFTRATGFPVWNRYAAVNDEFIPIHMDDTVGQAAGMNGAFGMGNYNGRTFTISSASGRERRRGSSPCASSVRRT